MKEAPGITFIVLCIFHLRKFSEGLVWNGHAVAVEREEKRRAVVCEGKPAGINPLPGTFKICLEGCGYPISFFSWRMSRTHITRDATAHYWPYLF